MGKLELDDVVIRIHDLRKYQAPLQAKRVEIESQMSDRKVAIADLETTSSYIEDLHILLKGGSLAKRKTFIKRIVKEIKITGAEVLLTYTLPMLPNGLTVEKVPVLPTA
jgi:hypothetical protein